MKLAYTTIILALATVGLAQPEDANWNIGQWGTGFAPLAGGVVGITWAVRRFIWKSLDGVMVKGFAVAIGLAIGVALGVAPGGYEGVMSGAWNGILAGLASFLGVDAVRDIVGGQGTSEGKK